MYSKKKLGAYDTDGKEQNLVFSLGKVKVRGNNLPSGKNHADCIKDNGNYDIVLFSIDHKSVFPNLSKVVLGQLAPHITTKVDCVSLFGQVDHLSNSNWNRTVAKRFERLVMLKNCLSRIYYERESVKQEFMDRMNNDLFSEEEDRGQGPALHQSCTVH